MSYEDLLSDRCDIYHLTELQEGTSFGVPGETKYSYPEVPDLQNFPSLFVKENVKVEKNEPGIVIVQSFLVHFLVNTDVRFNDKVIFNGQAYRLQVPRNIRSHHIEVIAIKDDLI
jgi:hypothetical protein